MTRRMAALGIATLAVVAGGVFAVQATRDHCFQYDRLVDGAEICGSQTEIEQQQFERGRAMAESAISIKAGGSFGGPVEMCLLRAEVQAGMNDWPDRYRSAYANGCRAAGVVKS